jgi:Uma2 family endonuclease
MSTSVSHTRLGPRDAGALMTPSEFDSVRRWKENYRYELINGVLVVTPPPSSEERGSNELLGYHLLKYAESDPNGTSLDVTLTEHTVLTVNRRRADRAIWAGHGRVPDVDEQLPTIVVEFVSSGRRNQQRDYEAKREEYLAAGVREYWTIDRFRRAAVVVSAGSPPVETVVPEDGAYESPLLPGFILRPSQLFAAGDRIRAGRKK